MITCGLAWWPSANIFSCPTSRPGRSFRRSFRSCLRSSRCRNFQSHLKETLKSESLLAKLVLSNKNETNPCCLRNLGCLRQGCERHGFQKCYRPRASGGNLWLQSLQRTCRSKPERNVSENSKSIMEVCRVLMVLYLLGRPRLVLLCWCS